MQITVKLQDMFSYSFAPILLFGTLAVLFCFIASNLKKAPKKKPPKKEKIRTTQTEKPKNISSIKAAYFKQLVDIEKKYSANELTNRKAYQKLSLIVRQFVYEVTNIKVTNYTLQELKELRMPKLYELIEEFYTPEFAAENDGNLIESIQKARKVIEEWN